MNVTDREYGENLEEVIAEISKRTAIKHDIVREAVIALSGKTPYSLLDTAKNINTRLALNLDNIEFFGKVTALKYRELLLNSEVTGKEPIDDLVLLIACASGVDVETTRKAVERMIWRSLSAFEVAKDIYTSVMPGRNDESFRKEVAKLRGEETPERSNPLEITISIDFDSEAFEKYITEVIRNATR